MLFPRDYNLMRPALQSTPCQGFAGHSGGPRRFDRRDFDRVVIRIDIAGFLLLTQEGRPDIHGNAIRVPMGANC